VQDGAVPQETELLISGKDDAASVHLKEMTGFLLIGIQTRNKLECFRIGNSSVEDSGCSPRIQGFFPFITDPGSGVSNKFFTPKKRKYSLKNKFIDVHFEI
jgi:hypothetical protein